MVRKKLCVLLSVVLGITLFAGCACSKKEETVTGITKSQFNIIYGNAKDVYAETPEAFLSGEELDLGSDIADAEIVISEAMQFQEAIQTIVEENFPEELETVDGEDREESGEGMDESFYKSYIVAKQFNLITGTDTNYDEAITKAEAIDLILKSYEAIAKRDGYATTSELGLNEGSALNRGDQTEITGEGYNGAVDINGNPIEIEDIVEGTTLTQEELDQLKANAKDDWAKENVEIYEDVTSGDSWTDDNGTTYDKVVGAPDNSWRRMTDEEAQAIISKGPDAEGYKAAQAELEGTSWTGFDGRTGTIYFDYYAYAERMAEINAELKADPYNQPTGVTREENPELYEALFGK